MCARDFFEKNGVYGKLQVAPHAGEITRDQQNHHQNKAPFYIKKHGRKICRALKFTPYANNEMRSL